MTAVIIAVGRQLECGGVLLPTFAEFLPIAGRSVIQRHIELLADRGFRDLTFVLREEPQRFRAVLGSGERWGVKIKIFLCGPGADPGRKASEIALSLGGAPVFDCLRYPEIPGQPAVFAGTAVPDFFSLEHILDSAALLLRNRIPGIVPPGRERGPGVRLSHHVSIHPSARLVPPVFLADGVEIGPDAVVGPEAILERGVIVGKGTEVAGSLIMPWTMLGDGLDIRDAIVDGGSVFKPRAGAAIVLDDTLIASSWRRQPLPASFIERIGALFILGTVAPILLPLALIAALSGSRPFYRVSRIVATPDRGHKAGRRTRRFLIPSAFPRRFPPLIAEFLPALVNVAAGVVAFWGLPPRDILAIQSLPEVHTALALTAKMGLLGEWRTLGSSSDEWERFATEAWQASGQRYPHPRVLYRRIWASLLGAAPRPADSV